MKESNSYGFFFTVDAFGTKERTVTFPLERRAILCCLEEKNIHVELMEFFQRRLRAAHGLIKLMTGAAVYSSH